MHIYVLNTLFLFTAMMVEIKEFYKSAKALGLNKKEIDAVLNDVSDRAEQSSFYLGPPMYPGGRYGTFSINVF